MKSVFPRWFYLSLSFVLMIGALQMRCSCDVTEPEDKTGSMRIQAGETVTIVKALESIGQVHCTLMRGAEKVHEADHTKTGNQFVIVVEDLEPAENYSVLLLGRNDGGEYIGRGYLSSIIVNAGKESSVSINWARFNPVLISPADGLVLDNDKPAFEWSSVPEATGYELQVDSADSFSNPVIDEPELSSTNHTPSDSLDDGPYYWRVRSRDSQGNLSGWSDVWSFTIDQQGPPAPSLIAPENASTIEENRPAFEWSSAAGVAAYSLQVSSSEDFTDPVIDEPELSSANHTPSDSLDEGSYFWRVRGRDVYGNWGSWSDKWSFTIVGLHVVGMPNRPSGPSTGMRGESLSFSTGGSSCSQGHLVEYRFDWDDGSISTWGSENRSKSYSSEGTYSVTAQARCKTNKDIVSSWSRGKSVAITGFETGTMKGNDGKTYVTIKIGDQWWMMENLKETKYRNGNAIPNVTDSLAWPSLSTGAYCAYRNSESLANTHGYLYNWFAVDDSRNIAPSGWRVPTEADWKQLEMFLGMIESEADALGWRGTDEGGKLKETGTSHWNSPNTGATNESGFTALPSGYLYLDDGGGFGNMGNGIDFWSATASDANNAWFRYLSYGGSQVYRNSVDKRHGFSVRLIRE